jgi:hypothetical protein
VTGEATKTRLVRTRNDGVQVRTQERRDHPSKGDEVEPDRQ